MSQRIELVEKHFMKKIRKQNKYKDTEKTLPEHKQEIKDLYAIYADEQMV